MTSKEVIEDLKALREKCPMVHNITNFVVMNNTANALLAIGASPVMAHAPQESADMAAISSALVINIGTLSQEWIQGMVYAGKSAKEHGIPVVFDPVGAGATTYRNDTCAVMLNTVRPDIIRCNAGEVTALCNVKINSRGVDSSVNSDDAVSLAKQLAKNTGAIVSMSGATDYITDGESVVKIDNGTPMMPKVTGLGCSASAITGAFAGVQKDYLRAAVSAMAVMGVAGDIATEMSKGPGSLQMNFLDVLYNLSAEDIEKRLKIS